MSGSMKAMGWDRSVLVASGVNVVAGVIVVCLLATGHWQLTLCFLPVFLIDLCVSARKHGMLVGVFKAFLLCQSLALWYLNAYNVFQAVGDIRDAPVMQNTDTHPHTRTHMRPSALRGDPDSPMGFGGLGELDIFKGQLFPVKVTHPALRLWGSDQGGDLGQKEGMEQVKASRALLKRILGPLPESDFPDLKPR
eukprot:CAMPEP_0173373850 /NCGR_PEP_ID=MMETSP1144-20121109/28732_1 /TAXON_ID=483371 /ORGANISM="non described non described, Strain CCMP2298" /LENGTH=193 /DNA_ID=CAMNT_0014326081 /DNA_START=53 /DNA_END=630 /DNA_ORIENTATION=-